MGKYRSTAFKGFLDKEVAQEIADFIGAVTEQEAIVIVSCPRGNYITGKEIGSIYYLDPEAAEAAKEMYECPELKVLFDASRNVTKEDILSVANILEKLKKDQFGDEE